MGILPCVIPSEEAARGIIPYTGLHCHCHQSSVWFPGSPGVPSGAGGFQNHGISWVGKDPKDQSPTPGPAQATQKSQHQVPTTPRSSGGLTRARCQFLCRHSGGRGHVPVVLLGAPVPTRDHGQRERAQHHGHRAAAGLHDDGGIWDLGSGPRVRDGGGVVAHPPPSQPDWAWSA